MPDAELTILGGDEHVDWTRDDPLFARPGIEVLGHRDDVPTLLAACTLTLNPLRNIRGSAVKLVESLGAGRLCISTADGARGMPLATEALVVVDDVAAMADPIVALLRDDARRQRAEGHAYDKYRDRERRQCLWRLREQSRVLSDHSARCSVEIPRTRVVAEAAP